MSEGCLSSLAKELQNNENTLILKEVLVILISSLVQKLKKYNKEYIGSTPSTRKQAFFNSTGKIKYKVTPS